MTADPSDPSRRPVAARRAPQRSTPLALTTGEPAGIGPEIALHAALRVDHPLVLLGDRALLETTARVRRLPWPLPARVAIEHVPLRAPVTAGRADIRNAPYVLEMLDRAVDGCLREAYAAVATAPVHKAVIAAAGVPFSGHTEFLAQRTGAAHVVMLLVGEYALRVGAGAEAGAASTSGPALPVEDSTRAPLRVEGFRGAPLRVGDSTRAPLRVEDSTRAPLRVEDSTRAPLRVALATTHLPLAEVPRAITSERLARTLDVLHDGLRSRFGIAAPRIAVAGLNPHAGEEGLLGREEIDVIAPAVAAARARGIDAQGPLPADTLFVPDRLAAFDAVLAMYHDQGLPVLKHASFGHGVNVTLGLPIVRTSVDHGTALDLAGTGRADPGSMIAALRLALELARRGA